MSSRAKPTIICCILAPPSLSGGLAGMHVWPSQCGKLRTVLHCGTWISPSGRWRRCCVCSRGSVSMRRAYACGMQSTRAEVCGEWPTNRWVNLHEACKCGDCWIGQWNTVLGSASDGRGDYWTTVDGVIAGQESISMVIFDGVVAGQIRTW